MRYILASFLLLVAVASMAQSTIESIPNQKLINGSYVSNPDKILDERTITQIDTLLKSIEVRTTAQIAVVAVESIGDDDIFEFAQKLFTTWGIGRKDKDNGLLLLLVKDQRTIRFHTGYGLEGVLPDVVCKRIQRDYMVPEFKNGNYSAGILAGLMQVEKILNNPQYADELRESETVSDWTTFVTFLVIFVTPFFLMVYLIKSIQRKFADSKDPHHTPYPEMRLTRWTWIAEFVGIPILIIVLYGTSSVENPVVLCYLTLYLYFLLTLFHRLWRAKQVINRFLEQQEYYEIVEFIRSQQWYWFFIAIAFPIPFVVYFFYHLSRKRAYRNHSRSCKQCQGKMTKLAEQAEDEYLSQGQQMEETLRAVDYDVWKCTACASIDMWFYLNRNSKYEPCPKCKTIAYHFVSDRTIKSATYSSSGKGEKMYTCKFCGHNKKTTYTISRLVESSSSSSGSSSGSSSSSGGSWGGGSSGGGGASSSW